MKEIFTGSLLVHLKTSNNNHHISSTVLHSHHYLFHFIKHSRTVIPKMWIGTQFGTDCKTDKLMIADKENVLSPLETKTDQQMHVYSWVGAHASIHFEGLTKGNLIWLLQAPNKLEKKAALPSWPRKKYWTLWKVKPGHMFTFTHEEANMPQSTVKGNARPAEWLNLKLN